jgi:4-amino-4-deoxy-L-arabinose transferase-like glycosyltransferase
VSVSRRWLAVVLVLFCLPLFIGLRSLDLETDEAIYSFAVDRILEIGDWLQPKSSPSETAVFLEKPPLKFWIVAAPIRAGLLPHNEFGLRFWDALFGGLAFLYVFAIGSVLAGPVCGFVAVLLLFVHWPLLLDHGLRTNNMEGPLFLCYCGGIYHFVRWSATAGGRTRAHAIGVGLYFVLGFMTKFVAALFLPLVLVAGALPFQWTRRKLLADWRAWLSVIALTLALIAPWFIYAFVQFGRDVWDTMFAAHVFERMTVGLNKAHIHPWHYYFGMMAEGFERSGVRWLVPSGVAVLLLQAVRRRWFEATIVLLWAAIPLAIISAGSSKLYHYAYPFLPPLTLAVGYVAGLLAMLGPPVLRKWFERAEDRAADAMPRLRAAAGAPALRIIGMTVIVLATALILGAVAFGSVRVAVDGVQLFKSSSLLRPLLAIALFGLLLRRSRMVAPLLIVLLIVWWVPVRAYEATVQQLRVEKHPLRTARDCLLNVEKRETGRAAPGLFVDTDATTWHPIYYYFRQLGPWTRPPDPSPDTVARNLNDPAAYRPSLVQESRYREYLHGPYADRFAVTPSPPMIGIRPGPPLEYLLILPGPYGACSPEAALRAQ